MLSKVLLLLSIASVITADVIKTPRRLSSSSHIVKRAYGPVTFDKLSIYQLEGIPIYDPNGNYAKNAVNSNDEITQFISDYCTGEFGTHCVNYLSAKDDPLTYISNMGNPGACVDRRTGNAEGVAWTCAFNDGVTAQIECSKNLASVQVSFNNQQGSLLKFWSSNPGKFNVNAFFTEFANGMGVGLAHKKTFGTAPQGQTASGDSSWKQPNVDLVVQCDTTRKN